MSKSQHPQPEYIFYLDECLGGNKICGILKQAGHRVETHINHFPRGTPDEEWLPVIGKRDWVLLTQDKAIRRRKNEQMALRDSGVRAFIIAAKNLRGEEIGQLLLAVMPKILRTLKHTHAPFIAIINRDSIVELREGRARNPKRK